MQRQRVRRPDRFGSLSQLSKDAHCETCQMSFEADFDRLAEVRFKVARAVREMAGGAGPLMIAISGQYTKSADRVLSEMSGFNYFVSKPFDPNALMALVVAPSSR